ncbi:hypothetical protein [Paenibacillus sp. AR247]|uniref:hypothetical protein n=1 Tax=Paenibacillus sp. AR247 TaxID=1631599 RepID=UPI00215771A0|nr:hypothetical protein [Paenibacillus sp. AR247]
MSIGSLLRGMMGDTKAGETKQLDLKEGQVVRGVVLSVSEDGQEAVLQIQGVKVRAALETPLQPGQAAVLQVQPDNGGGLPVLKAMEGSPYGSGTPMSLADVLQSLDLPDTPGNARQPLAAPAAGQGAAAEAGPTQPGPAPGAASAAGAAAAQPAPQAADGPELTVRPHAVQQQPPGPAHHAVRPEQLAEPAAWMEQALQETGQRDTLKGLLLQLVQDDAAPPALKEAAQQVISQLTGQQLLLNTDRTAPFAQVTLSCP